MESNQTHLMEFAFFCWQLYDFMPNGGQVCVSVIESPTNSVHEMSAQFPLKFRSTSAQFPLNFRSKPRFCKVVSLLLLNVLSISAQFPLNFRSVRGPSVFGPAPTLYGQFWCNSEKQGINRVARPARVQIRKTRHPQCDWVRSGANPNKQSIGSVTGVSLGANPKNKA
jgi:hypothetical protein